MKNDLEGKISIVTGGTRGIGRGISKILAENGSLVAAIYGNSDIEAQSLLNEIGNERLIIAKADLSSHSECRKVVDLVVSKLGGIDILVNNAAICPFRNIFDIDPELWNRTWETNVSGPFFMSQYAGSYMKENGGSIINIGSIGIFLGSETQVHYNATKGALFSMTRSLAVAFGKYNIRVNCLAVGGVPTDMNKDQYTEDYLNWLVKKLPLHKMGTPDDIGEMVAFLASERAAWITGALIPVDGGRLVAP
ncbi:MAG: SDR family oxidoreductase [Thermoplasmatales archaeon]|nr:SDR family oxidoreductase [Thermoplasmatales archaeon]MCW6170342.1 SDR family oxidoreductase [Thermoplasmatales archaeon]